MKATLVLLSAASLLMSAPAFAENSAIGMGRAHAASQSGAVAASGNSVANASNNTPKQAPGIAAPGLAASAIACLGSVSGGGSVAGFGAGLGATYLDRNCEARIVADQLYRYGFRKQAVQLLINEHRMVRRAFADVPMAEVKP